MTRITSIKKLLHTNVCDKIELIINNNKKIIFDFIQSIDSVDKIFYELKSELQVNFENNDMAMNDLQTLIKSNRIRTFLYD